VRDVPNFRRARAWREAIARGRTAKELAMRNLSKTFLRDERGGEVMEYALIAGLIIVAAIAVIGAVGTKVVAHWTSLNTSF